MVDHGGNLDQAIRQFGGRYEDWLDLSTGINPVPYPIPNISSRAWTALPTTSEKSLLHSAVKQSWHCSGDVLSLTGAQAAIQLLPQFAEQKGLSNRKVTILGPTYNEYANSFKQQGWQFEESQIFEKLAGSTVAILVNPNNPDGKTYGEDALLDLLETVDLLIIDESFVDSMPELSLCSQSHRDNLIILRSFGKFYGLAGLRLGFVIGSAENIHIFEKLAGPWPVSGVALAIGAKAIRDHKWSEVTRNRLQKETQRLDQHFLSARCALVGGTPLFRLYSHEEALDLQIHLAKDRIWSRIFPYSENWIRLGLPGTEKDWSRLEKSLASYV
ncbi:MAG: threonine-phosphate decarboxylase CobD [Sneathiellales bacterium]|nr:threonine-phosphate decarboxylase CobD [Sneathiellales bacterium]